MPAARAGLHRVVITGAGTINALGHDVPSTLAAMREGRCGIGPLSIRDVERLSVRIGGQVTGFDEAQHFSRQELSLYDRFTQFALIAAREAMAQSGLAPEGEAALRIGVVLGNSGGGLGTTDDNYRAVYEEGKSRVHPFVVPRLMNNAAASHISMVFEGASAASGFSTMPLISAALPASTLTPPQSTMP